MNMMFEEYDCIMWSIAARRKAPWESSMIFDCPLLEYLKYINICKVKKCAPRKEIAQS